jgi:quinol-cytochrome oxidoreductase complex cytochrome b subunit
MIGSLLIFLILPFVHTSLVRTNRFKTVSLILFVIFICNFYFLMVLGGSPIEEPYTFISQISTVIYFAYFALIPVIGVIENSLFSIGSGTRN